MNINQLKYIIAIDKYKHFTRAAESCDIAQSTLSREVQKLELELDVMIFDRTRMPVVPTQKGKDLLEIANKILSKIKIFEQTARNTRTTKVEYFNLGIWSCIAPYILPVFLKRFTLNHPNIRLNIFELSLTEIQDSWIETNLDGCFIPDLIQKSGYYESLLYEEEFEVHGTKPSKEGSEIEHKLIHIDLKPIVNQLLPAKDQESINFQNSSIETIRKIVEHNGGITILPKSHLLNNRRSKYKFGSSYKVNINFVSPRIFEKEEIMTSIKIEFKSLFSTTKVKSKVEI